MTSTTFQTSDGIRLTHDVTDSTDPWARPDPLILLHAATGSRARWYTTTPAPACHPPVVRSDRRDYGGSEVPGADRDAIDDHPGLKPDDIRARLVYPHAEGGDRASL